MAKAKTRQETPVPDQNEVTATVTSDDKQLASAATEAASVSLPGASAEAKPEVDLDEVDLGEEKFVDIKGLDDDDQAKVREFMQKVVEARTAREKAEQPVPPPPLTSRQKAQIEEEQAAGRRAVARHAEQQKLRPPPAREKSDGSSNPVFRPGDYVPGMDKGNVGAREVEPRE